MTDTKKTPTKTKETKQEPLISANTVVKLTVPAKVAEEGYATALKKLAKKVSVPGFRKGKVPAKVAEETVNTQAIIEETLQAVIPELYTKEIEKLNLKPLTYPEFNPISLNKGEDWIVEAYIAQRPEFSLKGYEKIVNKAKKDAEKELATQLKKAAEHAIEHEKECKDETHKHETKEPTPEEKKDFTLQFIYREIVTEIKPQIQELLVKEETRYDLEQLASQLKQFNIPFEKFLAQRNMTWEQLSNELAAGALGRLQIAFIIDEIAKTEKITVEKADLDEAFSKVTDEALKKQQESDPRYIEMMSQTILRQKVATHLLSL